MLILMAFMSHDSFGQLITDSQRRLKTAKPANSGSSGIFKQKKGQSSSGSGLRQSQRSSSPRSASGSPFASFRKRQTSPRSISGRHLRSGHPSAAPRYSAGSPFRRKKYSTSPRYSKGDAFKPSLFSKLFQKDVSPRYSPGSPFRTGKKERITPRSDSRDHFHVDKRKKKENAFYNIGTVDYQGSNKGPTLWTHKRDRTKESKETKKFEGVKAPIYGPNVNVSASEYSGNIKMKSLYKKNMHPSAKHLKANQNNEDIRAGLRKWNIFWTRINRNKPQPDAVTKKVSKPKFDRKEADIWNE